MILMTCELHWQLIAIGKYNCSSDIGSLDHYYVIY